MGEIVPFQSTAEPDIVLIRMWAQTTRLPSQGFSTEAMHLAQYLCGKIDPRRPHNRIRLSVSTIRAETGLSERRYQRARRELTISGVLRVRQTGRAAIYEIVINGQSSEDENLYIPDRATQI